MTRQELVDELVVERFGPRRLARPGHRPAADADPAVVVAERQRVLCEAVDGRPLAALVDENRAAA